MCQYPNGVLFGENADDKAKLVIGIAAKNDEHVKAIAQLVNALENPDVIEKLTSSNNVHDVLKALDN